jgi:TPP-dependent indolepyruvate ferredoxin oxidoreductase alpha subunit
LIRTASRARFTRPDGTVVSKFVYLDMEEYRDKELTAEAFMRTLDRDGLKHVRAGIALQSYIPDTFRTLLRLQAWARERVAGGGGRITIRLVKGANMESERAEASMRGSETAKRVHSRNPPVCFGGPRRSPAVCLSLRLDDGMDGMPCNITRGCATLAHSRPVGANRFPAGSQA